MDECRDRGGALHSVEKPRLQRKLCRLSSGCEEEQQADSSESSLVHLARLTEDVVEGH